MSFHRPKLVRKRHAAPLPICRLAHVAITCSVPPPETTKGSVATRTTYSLQTNLARNGCYVRTLYGLCSQWYGIARYISGQYMAVISDIQRNIKGRQWLKTKTRNTRVKPTPDPDRDCPPTPRLWIPARFYMMQSKAAKIFQRLAVGRECRPKVISSGSLFGYRGWVIGSSANSRAVFDSAQRTKCGISVRR